VIVLDLIMPGVDGFQTMQHLKLNPATTHIPIVVLTAMASTGNRQRAARSGAEVVLSKPCTAASLREAVEAIVRRSSDAPRDRGE
jgi:two-component system cell cycle response regulator